MNRWESAEGSPIPLGASWIASENAYNFALYSKHAEKVALVFFGDDLVTPVYRYEFEFLRNKTGPIWHCRIPDAALAGAKLYAYQIDGPTPGPGFEWHAFDPEKLLLDPYARDVHFSPDFDREAARRPGSNWGRAPLSVLDSREAPFDWQDDAPVRHQSDLIIYEMHVRGFTNRESSGVAPEHRGTFAGIVDKIPYLQKLGVTAIELMPVFQFDPQEENYWGYMPLSFFAPHDAYCVNPESRHQHVEFCTLVQTLHRAGIEVILDVVFNHTCEGDERGPTYSFKGLDSTTYYLMTGNPPSPFANYSGTGNTMHTSNRAVRQLIMDSLRYWTRELHVDGFRFDLASVFTRNTDGSINTEDPDQKTTRSRLLLMSLDHPARSMTTIADTRFPSGSTDPKTDQTLHFRSAAGDLIYYFQGSAAKAWSISQETAMDLNDELIPAADKNPQTGKYYQAMTLIRNRYLLGTATLDLASGKSTPLFNPNDLADGQDGIWYCDGKSIYLTNALIALGQTEQLNLHIFDMTGSFVQSLPVDIKEQGYMFGLYTDASDRVFWVSSNSPGGLPDWIIDKAAIGSNDIRWRRMYAPGDKR